jgi:nucleoside-diphosphate-sugar epimerase
MEFRKGPLEGMEVMKVLIFGSSGFVGSNVTRYFTNNGEEVHVCLRNDSNTWRIGDLLENLIIHRGDLSSTDNIESIISSVQPDVVINCTGIVAGFGVEDQEGVIQKNLVNTVNLVNTCVKLNVNQLLNTGSAYECGFSNNPIVGNECSNAPIGLYGIAKKAEREYIDMIAQKFEKKYVTLRLFTPFGYFDSPIRLIPYIILSLANNRTPHIKNPFSGRDFIFIEDVSKIYYALSKKPEVIDNKTIFNLGTGKMTKVTEIAKYLFNLGNVNYVESTIDMDGSAEYLYAGLGETSKILSELNITFTPLAEALRRTYDWFIQNKNYYTFPMNNGIS